MIVLGLAVRGLSVQFPTDEAPEREEVGVAVPVECGQWGTDRTQWAAERILRTDGDQGGPAVRITLPDGRMVRSDDPAAGAALSEALGRSVTLLASAPRRELRRWY